MKALSILFVIFLTGFCLILGAGFYIFNNYTVDFSPLAHYNPGHPSILLDDQGNEWGRFQLDRREPIPLDAMPLHVRNAFLAAEDWDFFNHHGISYKGIIRSLFVNLRYGKKKQGASTITQQLVKLLFFDSAKTYKRKIKEQIYAILVEKQFTKEQILETYLNHVYFGFGIYGVEAASQRFWGKHASQLTIDESATLAAVIRSPGHYCPIIMPEAARKRRNVILHSMQKLGFISDEHYQKAIKVPIIVKEADTNVLASHLKEMIRIQLEEELGKGVLYTGGLIIQTTINRHIQECAQKSFHEHMTQFKKEIMPEIDGGLLTIDSKTGEIKAMVGGYDFNTSKVNRAWQAKRQMGSVFKPIIFAAAIQAGASFADTEIDEPITIEQYGALWQPNNYNKRFEGQMTLAHSVVRSNNIVSVKTLLKTGIPNVVQLAQACHLEDKINPYPSLALGCIDAKLKEVIGMFNIFANKGQYIQPYVIKLVKDQWGTRIYKSNPKHEQVLPEIVVDKVTKVLELPIKRWRHAYKQQLLEDDVICKTGTTNDCRTCWFAGSTPELTTAIYIGCDDNRSMGDVYPIKTAFPIWLGLHSALPPTRKKFNYHPSLRPVLVNQYTGRLTRIGDSEAIEIFI